ncbi:hypothetical protein DFH11DRAFT_7574 [Phellopilus nigrolimitatus]|nr:hypothetical protein DFH11DRAFT_7574 [Phellopilus nigrolimitatus]
MSKSLSVSYDLHPPAAAAASVIIQPSKTHAFPVPSGGAQQEFYNSLRDAVVAAKAQIGDELTAWRDAVGTSENAKEPKKRTKAEDEDEDEDVGNEGEV